jgi:hypothetical protein
MIARRLRVPVAFALVLLFQSYAASARASDEVLDWTTIAIRAMLVPPAVGGALQPRALAIVHVSIFEAVNGIERRYTPIHDVDATAPRGASKRAAAVQAAYTALTLLFPAQTADLDVDLAASLAEIASDEAVEHSQSIARGREWGEQVARAVFAWRDRDGETATLPWFGGPEIGRWRPTPRPNPVAGGPELPGLPGAFRALAFAEPFVIPTPSSFRPAGPPLLTSDEYTKDFNEVKSVGEFASLTRTADQTQGATFWGSGSAAIWNRVAVDAARARHTTLSENSRLFALLNMAANDAAMAGWDAKVAFEFWRPITAIREASLDGNPLTIQQDGWRPFLVTPPYPDYTSGNQSLGGAYYSVLTAFFGDDLPVDAYSEAFGPAVVRSFSNFRGLADDALEARITAGIHFRFAMNDARSTAEKVAAYVMSHAAQPVHGKRVGQLGR